MSQIIKCGRGNSDLGVLIRGGKSPLFARVRKLLGVFNPLGPHTPPSKWIYTAFFNFPLLHTLFEALSPPFFASPEGLWQTLSVQLVFIQLFYTGVGGWVLLYESPPLGENHLVQPSDPHSRYDTLSIWPILYFIHTPPPLNLTFVQYPFSWVEGS